MKLQLQDVDLFLRELSLSESVLQVALPDVMDGELREAYNTLGFSDESDLGTRLRREMQFSSGKEMMMQNENWKW